MQMLRAVRLSMDPLLVFTIGSMAFMWNVSGLVICEAAHRAADTVRTDTVPCKNADRRLCSRQQWRHTKRAAILIIVIGMQVNHRFQEVLRSKLQLNYPLMDAAMEREVKGWRVQLGI